MTTRIILLRHAESADPSVFHGSESDIDLSERGVRQAEAIAEELRGFEPAVVVSSAMIRAHKTAAAIARICRAPHEIEADLHERRVGVLSGLPFDHGGIWSETSRRWAAGETAYAHAGAESYDEVRDRTLPAWRRVVARHSGKRIAIVSHGVVCKVLIASLIPHVNWVTGGSIKNVALNEVSYEPDGVWRLHRLNWRPENFTARGLG
jgi:2,3-bisphosphoglycerate-dependent phosphoglycerate mutase